MYKRTSSSPNKHQSALSIFRTVPTSTTNSTSKMKFTIALVLALAVAVSALPQFSAPRVVQILQKDEVRDDAGNYRLSYVSEDGTKLSETGKLVPNNEGDDQVLVKEGSYTFVTPEGRTYSVNYVADALGFRPVGEHIPKA